MKKVVLGLSLVALATSCKKLPEGGNKGVLKLEEGVDELLSLFDEYQISEVIDVHRKNVAL